MRISDKIAYVGSEAFRGCKTLREVVIQHGADGIAEDAFERGAALITADAVPALDDETFRIAEAVYNKNFAL